MESQKYFTYWKIRQFTTSNKTGKRSFFDYPLKTRAPGHSETLKHFISAFSNYKAIVQTIIGIIKQSYDMSCPANMIF